MFGVDLPQEFIGKTLRLVVMPAEEWVEVKSDEISTVQEMPERYQLAQKYKGDAPLNSAKVRSPIFSNIYWRILPLRSV